MPPFESNAFPVPMELRGKYPEHLRLVMEKNDADGWETASEWLREFPRFTRLGAWKNLPDAMPGHGLVLFGPVGTGKTSIASAWINHIALSGNTSVAFINDGALAHTIRKRWRDDDIDAAMQALELTGVVVVDDLLRLGTQHVAAEAEHFLRTRQSGGHPTIVTLNNDVQLPVTLASVLSTWTWAQFSGADLRNPEWIAKLL